MSFAQFQLVPMCPYCGKFSVLTDSAHRYGGHSYGMIYECAPCDAYVGVHKNSRIPNRPLGTLANAQLRAMRMKCHAAFDPLWKRGTTTRTQAYEWMAQAMGLRSWEAHIAKLDENQCTHLLMLIPSFPKKP